MNPLELECRLELVELPALGLLVDVDDREVRVAARRLRGGGRCLFLRRGGSRLLRRRRGALGRADRLDLDLRQRGAEAGLAAVAGLRPALADPDLVPAHVTDDLRRHLYLRRQVAVAGAAGEEDVRVERLPLVGRQPVDE